MDEPTPHDLAQFGILAVDEGFHRYDPQTTWWNESWFWDWYDTDGNVAGHCRLGVFPGQDRAWLWLFLWQDGAWAGMEQPHLPFSLVRRPDVALDTPGLSLEWFPTDPLQQGRLRVSGFGRILTGNTAGRVVGLEVDLDVHASGVPHSTGQHTGEGHGSDHYDARRFEQPISVRGRQRVGAQEISFAGHGERDHSWGPRIWDMDWTFLAANAGERSLQCVEVRIGDLEPFRLGYLHVHGRSHDLTDVSLDVELDPGTFGPGAARGRVEIRSGEAAAFTASIHTVSAHAIDLQHTQQPPRQTAYRRHLVRLTPDDAGPPFCGWLETHRLPG